LDSNTYYLIFLSYFHIYIIEAKEDKKEGQTKEKGSESENGKELLQIEMVLSIYLSIRI